jgi:hypothetical protein
MPGERVARDHRFVERSASSFDAPRFYLIASAQDPFGAAAAVRSWADGPPDLCVTSPSGRARGTAALATADAFVPAVAEPMLSGRDALESAGDFAARFATALRIVYALSARAAFVVCDDLPPGWRSPVFVDGRGLLRYADVIERAL